MAKSKIMHRRLLKLFMLTVCLIATTIVNSQTIDETIAYINDLLEIHQLKFRLDLIPDIDDNTVTWFDQEYYVDKTCININEKGMLCIEHNWNSFKIPKGTKLTFDKTKLEKFEKSEHLNTKSSVYLKELNNTVEYDIDTLIDEESDTIYYMYSVRLSCFSDKPCFYIDNPDKEPKTCYNFLFENEMPSIRLKNALEHLIQLAKQEEEYWEKDPFSE